MTDLLALIQSNQMLAAGVGTVLFGSLMYVVKGVPRWLYYSIKRVSTLEMSLNTDSYMYCEVLRTLGRYRIPFMSRNFSSDREGALGAGYGLSAAWYRGHFVTFERRLIESNMHLDERLDITVFGRDPALLRALMTESNEPQDADFIKVYAAESGGFWTSPVRKRKRSLDTIFVANDIKQRIVDRVEWFLANPEWYLARGIPYKLVFLLHGEPGTGKTSLVYGTASHFNRPIAALGTLANVGDHLRNAPEHSFVVLEDIDMLSTSREGDDDGGKDKKPPLNALHTLINTVDGLNTPDGMILFITTNYRDRLDPALIRPGRIDCDIEVNALGAEEIESMFVAFYGEQYRSAIRALPMVPRTGAALQTIFLNRSADEALEQLRSVRRIAA